MSQAKPLVFAFLLSLGTVACGSAAPEAEASWETQTVAEDETGGGESE